MAPGHGGTLGAEEARGEESQELPLPMLASKHPPLPTPGVSLWALRPGKGEHRPWGSCCSPLPAPATPARPPERPLASPPSHLPASPPKHPLRLGGRMDPRSPQSPPGTFLPPPLSPLAWCRISSLALSSLPAPPWPLPSARI